MENGTRHEMTGMKSIGVCCHVSRCVGGSSGRTRRTVCPTPPEGKAWKLVWRDEFDGDKLDESKWEVPEAQRRDGWWSPKAVSLDGRGHLGIATLKEGDKYLDGCARTRGKFEHAFGYYTARIRLQHEPGHWSAFWLFNGGVCTVGDAGRDGTEIDIMEKPWLDDRIQCALHWDGYDAAPSIRETESSASPA